MKIRRNCIKIGILLLILVMPITFITLLGKINNTEFGNKRQIISTDSLGINSLSHHDPFILNASDSSYASVLASVISEGTGAKNDPYIIEHYNITTALEINVTIQNTIQEKNISIAFIDTTDYFVIRNCNFGNSSIVKYSAIGTQLASNVAIKGCNVTDTQGPAIALLNSTKITIEHNILMQTGLDGIFSLYAENCDEINITRNLIGNSGGFYIMNTNNTILYDNEIHATMVNPAIIGCSIAMMGSNISIDANEIHFSGYIYIISSGKGYTNINITNNFMIGTQATHPSKGMLGAITVDGTGGLLDWIIVANNIIENTHGDGIAGISGSKGIVIFDINHNKIMNGLGKGIDMDGNLGILSPAIVENRITKNALDGIHLWCVVSTLVWKNVIKGHHNPIYTPPMIPVGASFPSAGIMIVDCPVGSIIDANTIHDNDYGIVFYDFSLPNNGHMITNNIITNNYYYGIMIQSILGLSGGASSVGNVIINNDLQHNNLGIPSIGIPETYVVSPTQGFDEWINGIGNNWGGTSNANFWSDFLVNPGGGVVYWLDFGFPMAGFPSPPQIIDFTPSPAPVQNTAPIVTPLNATGIIAYNNTDAVLRWSLSDLNLNGAFNGLDVGAKWNGTDTDFTYTTDGETYLEIPLRYLEAGQYNFTCSFNDTMGLLTEDTINVTILSNFAPEVTCLNGSSLSYDEWDLGTKGFINFTFSDVDKNIDDVIVSFNVAGSSFVWNNESEGYASIDLENRLYAGSHFCTVWVNDTLGNWDESTITIDVVPNSAPVVTAEESESNFTLGESLEVNWSTSDPEGNYDSFILLLDGEEIDSGTWDGGKVSVNISELELTAGEYNLTLICNDTLGLKTQDTTILTVIDADLPWWMLLLQFLLDLWNALWAWIIGLIASLSGLAIYIKRKKNRNQCPCIGQPDCYCDI